MHMVFAVFTLAVLVLGVLIVRIGVLQSIAYDLFQSSSCFLGRERPSKILPYQFLP